MGFILVLVNVYIRRCIINIKLIRYFSSHLVALSNGLECSSQSDKIDAVVAQFKECEDVYKQFLRAEIKELPESGSLEAQALSLFDTALNAYKEVVKH